MTSAPTPLHEFSLWIGKREVSVRHSRALVSWLDEQIYLSDDVKQYGLVLWPASIALALEIGQRAAEFDGRRVLELGAGVGLPGIVAAAVGARVTQTDRDEDALTQCRENAERNCLSTDVRIGDWSAWTGDDRYDWIIGSDIFYRVSLHEQLRAILDSARVPEGRVLVSDPIRSSSLKLLERMEREGWLVRMSRWTIGDGEEGRTIGVFELSRR